MPLHAGAYQEIVMKQALLLTLGHNSSAILVENGQVMCGYEEERLTGVKSDSAFPESAISEITKYHDIVSGIPIYISHWGIIPDEFINVPNRWFNKYFLTRYFSDSPIYTVSSGFSHHDCHAWSTLAFAGESAIPDNASIVVADGFGNYGEALSIYKVESHSGSCMPKLVSRAYGFSNSLGLFYQYATSYLGLKENQDEYKLLGYEANIGDILLSEEKIYKLDEEARNSANAQVKDILSYNIVPKYDPMCTIDALPATKADIYNHLDVILKIIGEVPIAKNDSKRNVFRVRTIISYYVQKHVELAMTTIINRLPTRNILLAGGVFMNVKLNSLISNLTIGKTIIMPLAGDQGAAIGMYHATEGDFMWPGHLFWGKRTLTDIEPDEECGLYVFETEDEAISSVIGLINAGGIVNIVRGSMEFGSRALCNTSSLMLPTRDNIDKINKLNDRSTVMPCAPVVTRETADKLFIDCHKVDKSLEYMICTRYFKDRPTDALGAAHLEPITGLHTGRLQIVNDNDSFMINILESVKNGILVNTSFNYHGVPIVFDEDDIKFTHYSQRKNLDDSIHMVTIVITDGGMA